ncbi:MAG: metal-dependent transcriptional regulator [Planctomycetia bacterium]|nr:metal-dependent transcriptional regulator [Planctomycetia bacterium]
MELIDRVEEVLETLWVKNVEQEQPAFEPSAFDDTEAIEELKRLGYIAIEDNKVRLSKEGLAEARNCARRHRLAERLLVDVLDIKKKSVHEAGCKFEHLLHKGLEENVCTLLGHPRRCPHGRPIPPGRCCSGKARERFAKVVMPLNELQTNCQAKVAYLHTENRDALQKILAMGVLPNSEIILLHKFPSFVMQLGKSQFAVDKEIASHIFVRKI